MNHSMMTQWVARVNQSDRLLWQGRHLTTVFLFEVDGQSWKTKIHEGRIESCEAGPFVMTNWDFALQTTAAAWNSFCLKLPPPGFHDVMAMLKFKQLKMQGNLYPLMSHLLYFKGILALMRERDEQ